jgi:hypothetical protein
MLEQVLKITEKSKIYLIKRIFVQLTLNDAKGGYSVRFVYSNLPTLAQPNPVSFPLLYIRKAGNNVSQFESSRLSYQ